jgi:hypothetical protein
LILNKSASFIKERSWDVWWVNDLLHVSLKLFLVSTAPAMWRCPELKTVWMITSLIAEILSDFWKNMLKRLGDIKLSLMSGPKMRVNKNCKPGSRSVQTIFLDQTHAVWARETWRKYLKLFKWPIIQSVFWRRNTTSMKLLARVLMLMQLSLRQSTLVWLFKLDETVTALHLLRRFTILSTNTIWRRLRPGIGTKPEPSWTKLSKPWWKYCYPNNPNKSFKIFLKT